MRAVNKPLTEIFEPNTLRNLTTHGNNPMPHTGNTFYLWVNDKDTELGKYLTQGNSWKSGIYSTNSYITLKADLGITQYLIQCGPQSQSSSFTIETREHEDNVRVIASGWGMSGYELFDGETKIFLEYLKEFQKRSEVES